LLNSTTSNDESSGLGDFQPLPNPTFNKKPEFDSNMNPELIKYSSVLPAIPAVLEEPSFGNYRQIYEQPLTFVNQAKKPYYANMGISSSTKSEMDKILEKLNYMTHLLEEQRNEKTNNIAEEFILYTFLGVFIIYIVDSFSRSTKYIR